MTVASVREESGRVLARSILATEEPTIIEFLQGMRGAIHVAFEEGTQAQWLHDLMVPLVDRVIVCDRRGKSRQGTKGDPVDASLSSAFTVLAQRPVLRENLIHPGSGGNPSRLRGLHTH